MPKELSEEEKALFRNAVKDVTPLRTKKTASAVGSSYLPKMSHKKREPEKIKTKNLSSYYDEEVGAETILSYSVSSLMQKRFKDLNAGKIPLDATIDLHGLRPDDAERALVSFIQRSYQKGARAVKVIHGKGGIDHKKPVLKNLVNCWLRQFPEILAFHSALPRDGGAGAVYILLRRFKGD